MLRNSESGGGVIDEFKDKTSLMLMPYRFNQLTQAFSESGVLLEGMGIRTGNKEASGDGTLPFLDRQRPLGIQRGEQRIEEVLHG
jgi:hypothetical protein